MRKGLGEQKIQNAVILSGLGSVRNYRVRDGIKSRSVRQDTTGFTFAVVTLGMLDDRLDLSKFDDRNYQ